ncbi:putative uncharacterized protein DDB_G0271606 isoform X3 [Melanotaenia boesemani]|uniref:putative uncharacterized protein DDB_G0271606 isoform X3 n=1 Tax=Melanotaenia boesemani TaxID=1250792 RepID=UPI001C05BABA|nr:putative uncharacterized protein DDB_G0271606 isoform X3 [Melanotaenia boesemani]
MSRREQLQRRQHRLGCRINQMENDQPRQHHGTSRIEKMEIHQQMQHDSRSALEEEERNLKYLKHRSILNLLIPLNDSIDQLQSSQQKAHHGIRSVLEQEAENLKPLKQRIEQMESVQPKNHAGVSSAQEQEENIRSFKQGCALEEEGEHLTSHKQRSALEEEERNLKYLKHSMDHLVIELQQQHGPRSALEEEERNLKYVKHSMGHLAIELQQHHVPRSILSLLIPLNDSIYQLESSQQKAHHDIRSVLEQEAENLKSLKQRIEQMESVQPKNHAGVRSAQKQEENIRSFKQGCSPEEEGEHLTSHKQRCALEYKGEHLTSPKVQQRRAPEQKEENPLSLKQRSDQMEMVQQKNQDGTRSAQKQEENLRSFKQGMEEIEVIQQQHHNLIRSVLQKDEENLNLLKQRSQDPTEQPKSFIKRIEYVEGYQHHHHNVIRSALEREEKNLEYLKQRITKLEEQLQQKSSALKAKEEELTSFKDRVAGEVALSMKTGSTISMNNPVNKFRLKEMYDELRCFWPKIKHELKLNKKTPEDARRVIQEQFKAAAADMKRKKEQLDDIFELKEEESEASLKVKQYRQSTAENLQLAIYSKKHAGSKKHPSIGCLPGPEGESPVDMMARLASECYWLGSLMALNNPPLYPDWENHPPSMDQWDILPRNVRDVVEKEPWKI